MATSVQKVIEPIWSSVFCRVLCLHIIVYIYVIYLLIIMILREKYYSLVWYVQNIILLSYGKQKVNVLSISTSSAQSSLLLSYRNDRYNERNIRRTSNQLLRTMIKSLSKIDLENVLRIKTNNNIRRLKANL